MDAAAPKPKHPEAGFDWRPWRRALVIVGGIVILVAAFYGEENWRGKRAWEQCRRDLEARGEVLDWNAYIPALVPDEQNIFKAPNIADWFTRGGRGTLSARINFESLKAFVRENGAAGAIQVTIVVSNAVFNPGDANLFLQYHDPVLARADLSLTPALSLPPIPLIVMDRVPLEDAIKNLARAAGLECAIEPKALLGESGVEPEVSFRWTNVTARQALEAVVSTYDLVLVEDAGTKHVRVGATNRAHVSAMNPAMRVYVDPALRGELKKLAQKAFEQSTNVAQGQIMQAPPGFTLAAGPINPPKPVRVLVRSATMPGVAEIEAFFRQGGYAPSAPYSRLQALPDGTNSFKVYFDQQVIAAADYLAWSDQFEPDFDLIREALKRPYARMDGDYEQPFQRPIPNFVAIRLVAQTLGARAQSCFLLGRSEQSLKELTLLHDLCRLLEGGPRGRPMTLLEDVIDVAVTGLFVSVVADGLQMKAWHEAQLATLQEQFRQIRLLPAGSAAFEAERAAVCRTFEVVPADRFASQFTFFPSPPLNTWQLLSDPLYLFLTFGPRGWVYQNMATGAALEQMQLDGVDQTNQLIFPRKFDKASHEVSARLERQVSPDNFLARVAVANFIRAWTALAVTQTKAGEAQTVCALERFRLAKGKYPETLDALVPQFIEQLPHDIIGGCPLKYRLIEDGKYLLYSVGWNETDDGGQIVRSKNGYLDLRKGDWVWTYPLN